MKWTLIGALIFCANAFSAHQKAEVVAGEYIVKIKQKMPSHLMSSQIMSKMLNVRVQEVLSQSKNYLLVKAHEPMELVQSRLMANDMVEYVQPNYVYYLFGQANDPKLDQLWGIKNTGQMVKSFDGRKDVPGIPGTDVNAEKAWDITTGSKNVIVAVIDTGVDRKIEDLRENSWINESEANGQTGVDDDQNGYVDDVNGYDFFNKDGDPTDGHGHGSHCAGTIGAKGDNATDVVGVNWNVTLMAVKIFSDEGRTTSAIIVNAIDYATNNGAHIMSNSWGGKGFDRAIDDAIQRAGAKDILFVVAAGNGQSYENKDNDGTSPIFPAASKQPNVLTVAAIDNRGDLAGFSYFGKNSVHVGAPGVNILSTTPKGLLSWSGTSMATPHVAGVAALLKAQFPEMKSADLKKRIMETVRPLVGLMGKTVTGGMVDAYAALTNQKNPPNKNDPANWEQMDYSVQSAHPYPNSSNLLFEIALDPRVEKFALHFKKLETEQNSDFVKLWDNKGQLAQQLSGYGTDFYSSPIVGNTVVIQLLTDRVIKGFGFEIDRIAILPKKK